MEKNRRMKIIINRAPTEAVEQRFLITWAAHHWFREYLFAIPNGGYRNKITAVNLKKEGVIPGVPDLFLAYPASGFHGLFVEMKRKKGGHLTDKQERFIDRLTLVGYRVIVAYGWKEASDAIKHYLQDEYMKQ